MTGHEIKETWLRFFENKGHKVEDSASLVPINDPTLLWINAGVAPLKGYFDGSKIPENPRIVNAQKCIRTNDIENVGETARHHTFFEMLGNFSIGDYFRDDVIPWAKELLTSEAYYGFDQDKLYITVYPTDIETKKKWLDIGIKEDHLIESYENYWEIGSGPCGPCTEIFYDRGEAYGEGDLRLIRDDIENDRFIEIWNIVFSQYNAKPNLKRDEYPELPSKNIDTGMGLERMAAVIQEKETNFETDLFFPVIKHIEKLSGLKYTGQKSFKVIADHIRTVVFAVSDGATLSNDGRGYVLRRLLRRAVKHGRQLGIDKAFLKPLVETVVSMMERSYPYLRKNQTFTETIIEREEHKFLETLAQGEKILDNLLSQSEKLISGKDAFMLYDTYGFPVELTEEYAMQKGYKVDKDGFEVEMEAQKERARSARKVNASMQSQNETFMKFKEKSTFIGYDQTEANSTVIKAFNEGVVTKETPFYAESGGQVSDTGVILKDGKVYSVIDVVKLPNGQFLHVIEDHDLKDGDTVLLKVDEQLRERTKAHHSATHLLFSTLREMLGDHISQQGSLVGPDYLRFDFNHFELLGEDLLLKIEEEVNRKIHTKTHVDVEYTTIEQAKERGAIAEFGEKYESEVRMVDMGDTLDLCGGTHVDNTEEIENFAIASVESKGSGIYRITALAKDKVYEIKDFMKGYDSTLKHLKHKAETLLEEASSEGFDVAFDLTQDETITGSYQDMINKRQMVQTYQQAVKSLEKTLTSKRQESSLSDVNDYLNQAKDGKIIVKTEGIDAKALKALADKLMDHLQGGLVFLVDILDDKLVLVAKSQNPDIHAGKLVKEAAQIAGGGGGGRHDFAQAGGKDVSKADDIIAYVQKQTS